MWEEDESRPLDSYVASGEVFEEGELMVEEGELMVEDPLDIKKEKIKVDFIVTELLETNFGEGDSLFSMHYSSSQDKDMKIREKNVNSEVIYVNDDICITSDITTSWISEKQMGNLGKGNDDTKQYKCQVCGAYFVQLGDLKRHTLTHTREKPYKCQKCGVGFSLNGNLKQHMRTHTGEKPYKCQVCSAGFAFHVDFDRHKLTHTGEKPHKCQKFGIEFAQNGNLKSHMLTHSGEKPYKCLQCDSRFAQSDYLKYHILKHR